MNTFPPKIDYKEIFHQKFEKLNERQKLAVTTIDGPLLVLAGPGSGKTEILALRVANILKKSDIPAHAVLCLTFTDAACLNMRTRLENFIGPDAYKVQIFTFHGFATYLISKHREYFYSGANMLPATPIDQKEIMENILSDLSFDNPYRSFHPEQGYVYLQDLLNIFSDLKREGINEKRLKKIIDLNNSEMEKINSIIDSIFGERINSKSLLKIEEALKKFPETPKYIDDLSVNLHYSSVCKDELEIILKEAKEDGQKILSQWKTKYTLTDDEGKRILKDYERREKMSALVQIYSEYERLMHERGFFDFDDMLMQVIEVLKNNNQLKNEIEENFQYILVDEFQDTNNAQLELLRLITSHPVNEGRPNVMAVGDDDQAIYKFQGAVASNIIHFYNFYRDVNVIHLDHNYRSHSEIVSYAKEMMKNYTQDITKILEMDTKEVKTPKGGGGTIIEKQFYDETTEGIYVANKVSDLLKKGIKPKEIAIIARHHKSLAKIAKYLSAKGAPIVYKAENNILRYPHIEILILILNLIDSLTNIQKGVKNENLAEIFSHPMWNIPRFEIWKVCQKSYESRTNLFEEMMNSPLFKEHLEFFVELSVLSLTSSVESILDYVLGNKYLELNKNKYLSPYKKYYSDKEISVNHIHIIQTLEILISVIKEHLKTGNDKLKNVVAYLNTYILSDIPIEDKTSFANMEDAISLLTAHGSKGLEFDYVFIISCDENTWLSRGRQNKISLPLNLRISPVPDSVEDHARLFYVSMTRARKNLEMTSYFVDHKGKEKIRAPFVSPIISNEDIEIEIPIDNLSNDFLIFNLDEKKVLKSIVSNYSMPVTHLNNFLNVKEGGPELFVKRNLLRFPESKSPSAMYGTAIHESLRKVYDSLIANSKNLSIKECLIIFIEELTKMRFEDSDFKYYKEKGLHDFEFYLKNQINNFSSEHIIEKDFRFENIVFNGSKLTGKIDKIVFENENNISVYDIKTGSPHSSWEEGGEQDKTNLHRYKEQLMFYKLLIETSTAYQGKKVTTGFIDFIEPDYDKHIKLEYNFPEEEYKTFCKLVEKVYLKIINLDFPDISKYSKDYSGMLDFENDLIN
jgi:DNA helicase-2/ATP-dependent DNA helicase PcrA